MVTTLVAGAVSFLQTDLYALGLQSKTKPKVLVIGTGGTIAGVARTPGGAIYDPGKLAVEAILAAIPEVKQEIEIEGRQLADLEAATSANPKGYVNVASSFIRERHWLILARWIEEALERDGFDAVIVTHGTDTLEETAFFAFVQSSRTGATHCHLKREDLWPNILGAATLSPQHLKILLQLFQASFETSGKNSDSFRDAVADFLSKWVPYPDGMLPKWPK